MQARRAANRAGDEAYRQDEHGKSARMRRVAPQALVETP